VQWVDLNKQKAKCIDPNGDPYDVLLDDYEKGMTSARLDEIFSQVRQSLCAVLPGSWRLCRITACTSWAELVG